MIRREIRDGGEGVERGLRWKQDRDKKRQKVTELTIEEEDNLRNIDTCLCLLSLKALRFS